jgi:hypothetical protein
VATAPLVPSSINMYERRGNISQIKVVRNPIARSRPSIAPRREFHYLRIAARRCSGFDESCRIILENLLLHTVYSLFHSSPVASHFGCPDDENPCPASGAVQYAIHIHIEEGVVYLLRCRGPSAASSQNRRSLQGSSKIGCFQ